MKPVVYVVHCIDTEGPLYESLDATFERLHHIFHLDLEPNPKTLQQLKAGELDLGGLETSVRALLSDHLLCYNDTWDKVDAMLAEVFSHGFRDDLRDSFGGSWICNWFCMDHVDYEVNPRRRDIGYLNIFDHYREMLDAHAWAGDGLHFHYHPHAFLPHANLSATHWWAASGSLHQGLCRRIIDRQWFPACNRPGFQVNRPDSHWFLEQYVPFDYASLAVAEEAPADQFDVSAGRSGDWRRAPRTWRPYHPSHDDYQTPGNCRRLIGRCLNIGSRICNITETEVRQAFEEARQGLPVVLSFADHDFRDIRPDIRQVAAMLRKTAAAFPDVAFRYCEASEAMRRAMALPDRAPCALDMELRAESDAHVLTVRTQTPSFGPQPFLALKTVSQTYHHDNFDFQIPFHEWTYTFDAETFPLRALEKIGVGVSNACGKTTTAVLDAATGTIQRRHGNSGGLAT